jgi:23S rRNA pseudouridine1911/1915/1917 synthase
LAPPRDSTIRPEPLSLDVLYEDLYCIVINKAPGIVVHPAAGHSSGTLVNALLYHCPDIQSIGGERRPGIVHRLDKDTSGVMIVRQRTNISRFSLKTVALTRSTSLLPGATSSRIEV